MNEINLCEILKGHEGETFWNPLVGNITYKLSEDTLVFFQYGNSIIDIPYHGRDMNNNMSVFPSKDQQDWNKWNGKTNPKVLKTWNDILNSRKKYLFANNADYCVDITGNKCTGYTRRNTPIEKSALALLKIHLLIEVGYGGNVTEEEWKDVTKSKWYFTPNTIGSFNVICTQSYSKKRHIAFHTEEQAKEFLCKPENFQLLKDYSMI